MNKTKRFSLLLSLPLLLSCMASCRDKTSDVTSDTKKSDTIVDTAPATEAPITTPITTDKVTESGNESDNLMTEWGADLSEAMMDYLGEKLPFVRMGKEFGWMVYQVDTNYILSMSDTSKESIVEEYRDILTENGFEFKTKDDSKGYDVFRYMKDRLCVEVSYQPGGEGYDSGNLIEAWIEPEEVPALTQWPDELKQIFTDNIGEELPFVPFDAATIFYNYYEPGKYLFVTDANPVNLLTDYGTLLTAAGFTFVSSELDENENTKYTYTKKQSNKEGYSIYVQYFYDEVTSGNAIYAFSKKDIVEKETETWPEAEIKTITDEKVPSFAVSEGKYTYYYPEEGVVVYGKVASDITAAYEAELTKNGFILEYDEESSVAFGYNWIENVGVGYVYDETKGTFEIDVMPMEKSYDSLETAFPNAILSTFLGEGVTEVPSFSIKEGNTYKVTHLKESYVNDEGIYIEALDSDNSIVEAYKKTLTEKGFTMSVIDGENVALSEKEDVRLTFASDGGVFYLFVTKNTPSVDGVFDFFDMNQIKEKDDDHALWSTKTVSFKIEKGTSSQTVGNGTDDYLANPLRVYAKQVITVSTTEGSLATLDFTTNGSKYTTALLEATVVGGTISKGDKGHVIVTCEEGVTSVTITMSKQVRLNSLTVTKK